MNEFVVTLNNKKITVSVTEENKAVINEKEYNFRSEKLNNFTYKLILEDKASIITLIPKNNSEYILTLAGRVIETKVLSSLQEKAARLIETTTAKQAAVAVRSPMPGLLIKIKKQPGDEVIQGDSLFILEAMKMENDIRSPVSGKIKEISVKEGQAVEKGVSMLIIE